MNSAAIFSKLSASGLPIGSSVPVSADSRFARLQLRAHVDRHWQARRLPGSHGQLGRPSEIAFVAPRLDQRSAALGPGEARAALADRLAGQLGGAEEPRRQNRRRSKRRFGVVRPHCPRPSGTYIPGEAAAIKNREKSMTTSVSNNRLPATPVTKGDDLENSLGVSLPQLRGCGSLSRRRA